MSNETRENMRLEMEEQLKCRLPAPLICSECGLCHKDELKMRVKTTPLKKEERKFCFELIHLYVILGKEINH